MLKVSDCSLVREETNSGLTYESSGSDTLQFSDRALGRCVDEASGYPMVKIKPSRRAVCGASKRHVNREFGRLKPPLADARPGAGVFEAAYKNLGISDNVPSSSPSLHFRAQKSALVGECGLQVAFRERGANRS